MKNNYIGLLRRKEPTDNPKKSIFGSYPSNIAKKRGWLTGMVATALLLTGGNAFAQTNISNYTFSKSTGATYTPITAGTKLFPSGTNTTYDNDISAAIPLSSPFTYGGTPVTSVYVSANGYITFGAAPSGTNYTPLATLGSTTGAISAFGQDAGSSTATGATPEISYLDSPTEFIVQYKDHANYYNRTTERLNFQIRLTYATGVINIVYGTCTDPGIVDGTNGITPQVGIRGNSVAYATNVSPLMIGNVQAGTTCDWSKAVTGSANSSTMLFSGISNVNVKIPAGLQYSWTPGTQLPVRTFAATTAVTNAGATLSWTAPTGATTYNVQYRALGACDWTNFSGNPVSATTATLAGLTQNTTYQIQVQALNGTAQSMYSHIPNLAGTGSGYVAAGSFTTVANCLSTVTGLASSAVTPDTATISWTASTTAPANGYEYYYSTSSNAPLSSATPSGSVGAGIITANLSGLLPSTQYYYWVRGNCNSTDKGVWSSSANFTTLGLCATVTAPTAGATGVSLTPTITWTALSSVAGYKLKVGTTSGGNDILDTNLTGAATTSYPFTAPLNSLTTYYYSVTGYTATTAAPATPCTVRNFTTLANCTSTVTGLASSAIALNTATISWTASTTVPGNGYEYYYSTSSTAPANNATPSGSVSAGVITANLSGLAPSTQYYYWVRGNCNGTDKGVWSSSANFTTLSLCATVTLPAANAVGVSTTPTITWTAVNGATGYRLTVGTTSGGTDIVNNVDLGNVTSYMFPSALNTSTKYFYSVSAYSATSVAITTCTVRNFTTVCGVSPVPFLEAFSGGALPNCWTSQNPTSTSTDPNVFWKFAGSADYGANLANNGRAAGTYAWVDASTPYAGIKNVELLSPSINLTGLTAPYVSFDWFKNHSTSTSTTVGVSTYDNNKLTVDINNGSGWVTIFTSTTNAQVWRTEGIALASTYIGTTVQLRFTVDKNVGTNPYFYDDVLLDNVEIKEAPACIVPSTLAFNSLTSTGATVTWAAPASAPALGYDVYHSATSTAPTGATTPQYVGVTATTQIIPGTPGNVFYVWVRSRCSASSQSNWVGPVTYTIPYPAPVNDNCSGATALTPGATFAQNVITTTNVGSTIDATPQSCQTNANNNVWFSVVVPPSGSLTIETKAAAGSQYTDSVINVFSGSCGSLTAVTGGCDDDGGDDAFSKVSLTGQTPGSTLLVSVWRWSNSSAIDGTFQISAYDASLSTAETVKAKNNIKAYPNPFVDVLNISDVSNVKSISVMDISGKLVKTFNKPESTLQLRELNSGMYLVVLNMKDGSKQTIKVIKK